MSKFCGNCGAQNENGDRICGNCGARLDASASEPPESRPEREPVLPKALAAVKKRLPVIGAAALILFASFLCVRIASSAGYKGAVRRVMKAYEKGDYDALVEMSGSGILADGHDKLARYRYQVTVGDALTGFDADVGGKYRIGYEIADEAKLTERQTQKRLEELARSGLIRREDAEKEIKDMVAVDVEVTAKRGNKSANKTHQLLLAKEKGGWKLFEIR